MRIVVRSGYESVGTECAVTRAGCSVSESSIQRIPACLKHAAAALAAVYLSIHTYKA